MKPADLHNGMTVEARFSRQDTPDGTAPLWSNWQSVVLFVRRREGALRTRKGQRRRKHYEANAIIELTVHEMAWATYVEDDYSEEFDEWLAEEYRMQLRPVKENS